MLLSLPLILFGQRSNTVFSTSANGLIQWTYQDFVENKVVKNKVTSQMANIAPIAAFYPFIKFQNPELGKVAEEGYNWIMTSDNLKATESITKILGQAKDQMGNNPQVKMMITQMLKDGLNKKMELLKQNPQKASSINPQIDAINKAIENFK